MITTALKTIVIGAGPAGAACAPWLHQLGCPVELLEKEQQAGGLQQYSPYENRWIPSVIGHKGKEVAAALHQQILACGVPLHIGTEVQEVQQADGLFQVLTKSNARFTGGQIVLATGAQFRSGGFQSSPTVAIGPGTPIEKIDVFNKKVAILGGGDNAFDQYDFIKNRGASLCKIFARNIRAQKKLQCLIPNNDLVIGKFTADTNTMTVNGDSFDIFSIQFGFQAVFPPGLQDLRLTAAGFIAADHWGNTSIPGIYAAGENTQTYHPCVTTSFSHGIQVAKNIQNRLGL